MQMPMDLDDEITKLKVRREEISERMKLLQDLVPGCDKVTGKALTLDEIINYMQSLQRQVERNAASTEDEATTIDATSSSSTTTAATIYVSSWSYLLLKYVGNIHTQVTEPLLQEVFASTGPLEGCKLIRKEKSSYGFVDYFDRRSAALAIMSLNGRHLFGQPIKVNWAYASGQREDTSGHFNIFVGDLSPEVTDATLFACFSVYSSCSDARVMWDQKTGHSRGFGFVSFRNEQEAQRAINDLTGKWLGTRQIRCNWATKGAGANDDKQNSDARSMVELSNGTSDDGQAMKNEDAPENNPQYTTVYVGNLAPEVTQLDLHRFFYALGAGVLEEVRVQRDKGFGFVRYNTHEEAAMGIQMGNANMLYGKAIKCSWGSKPTPPGTSSTPLPPPAAVAASQYPGLSSTDMLAYERQLAMSKMGGALMHQHHHQGQHALKPAQMGMGGSQVMYDGGFQNVAAGQQLMYYQ